jgi:hypothetical protein
MKKMMTLLLCLLLLPATVALADNSNIADTTWDLSVIRIIETDEYYDRDFITTNGLASSFRFGAHGDVVLTLYEDDVFYGTYSLSGNYLEMDFNGIAINSAIHEPEPGLYTLIFSDVLEDGVGHFFVLTQGTYGSSSPAAPAPDPAPAAPNPEPQQPEAPAGSGNVPQLEGTTWEIVRAVYADGVLDRDDLVRVGFLIEIEFRSNGVVLFRAKDNNRWLEDRGTYQLSGNALAINVPGLSAMNTVVQNYSFVITNFNNIGEDYTFRQTTSPASASDTGMPRWARDALIGGGIGAAVGIVVWLMKRNKKKTDEATPPGVDGAAPAYYPPPAPMASAPAAHSPAGTQRQLLCTSGPMAGATYPVSGSLRIGRDPNRCQVIFPADTAGVSALHCEVQPQPYGVLLIDHNSSHGTFLLNGRKLHPNESVSLNPGDGFYLAENKNSFKVL